MDAVDGTIGRRLPALAAKSGQFTAAELDAWLTSLNTAAAGGDYLFSIDDDIVVAAREPHRASNAGS
jgi:hypothetical protein